MENPSILSHVSLGTTDLKKAVAFYDAVLIDAMGFKKIMEFPVGTAYGKAYPEFWIQTPHNGEKAQTGNGIHVSFLAESPAQVDAFYKAALDAGATDDGPAGERPEYGKAYYGAFVRDLDGNKIEAMYYDESKA